MSDALPPPRYIAELIIADYLDPNLSMGGPRAPYKRKAREIVDALEHAGIRLVDSEGLT